MKTKSVMKKCMSHLLSILMVLSILGAGLTTAKIVSPIEASAESITAMKAGDKVVMGVASDAYIGTPSWVVLGVEENTAFLVSEYLWKKSENSASNYGLPFKLDKSSNEWDKSDAKVWCQDFYRDILKETEAVATYNIDDPAPDTKGGVCKSTGNKVFFMSVAEVKKYFPEKKDRLAKLPDGTAKGYWLRTPAITTSGAYARTIFSSDFSADTTASVEKTFLYARPAVKLDLSSVNASSTVGDGVTTWNIDVEDSTPSVDTNVLKVKVLNDNTPVEGVSLVLKSASNQTAEEVSFSTTSDENGVATYSPSGNENDYFYIKLADDSLYETNEELIMGIFDGDIIDEEDAAYNGEPLTLNVTAKPVNNDPITDDTKKQINQIKSEYNALKESDYTAETWAAYKNAVDAVSAMLNDDMATNTNALSAIDNVNTAKNNLVEAAASEATLNEYNQLVSEHEGLSSAVYTAESWKDYDDAVKAAKAVVEAENPTDKQLRTANNSVKEAKEKLEINESKYTLNIVVKDDENKAVQGASLYLEYPEDDYYNVDLGETDADGKASFTSDSNDIFTSEEGGSATYNLKLAENDSYEQTGQEIAVKYTHDKRHDAYYVDTVNGEVYTGSDVVVSVKAKTVPEETDPVKEELIKALEKAIADAANIKESEFSEESVKAFKNAVEAAKTVAAKADASKEEIKEAVDAIKDAREKLVKKNTDQGQPQSKTEPSSTPAAAPDKGTSEESSISASVSGKAVSAAMIREAIKRAEAGGKTVDTIIVGKNVKKISKNALKGTNVKTLVIKSKKLTKKSVKGSLKGSNVKTVKIKVGNKKLNKKYVKKYKKIFTKKNAGRKVSVKRF